MVPNFFKISSLSLLDILKQEGFHMEINIYKILDMS